jgi:proteasome lid subunit RPN8/RPN11
MDRLTLQRPLIEAMIRHARAEYPNEACGVLVRAEDGRVEVHPLHNADHSPLTYRIAGHELFQVGQWYDDGRLAAIYHSHTHTEAYPSPTDRRLAYWPEASYIIISLRQWDRPDVRAFRITKDDPADLEAPGNVAEITLEVL